MLLLRKLTLREIHLPLREPFRTAGGTQTLRRILLVEAEDEDGHIGWGECVAQETPSYAPETVETAWHAITAWLAPRVLHRPIEGPESLFALFERDVRGHPMAKAAVEMAAWELEARRRNVSLARMLGGTQPRVPVGRVVGFQPDPDALVALVRRHHAEGYRRIKLKIRPGADAAFVRAAREALGPDADLSADANGAYTLDDRDALRALDDLGLSMIEQPLGWDDLVRHAALQQVLRTPICLDESITSLERVDDMIALGSGRVVNLKPGRVGGLAAAVAIHDRCRAHGIPVWCGGMLESGIGRAHNVALASLPGFTLPGDLSPSRRYWEQDIVTPEWTMDADGYVTVPFDRPGMGVEVDRDRVENLTVRRTVL